MSVMVAEVLTATLSVPKNGFGTVAVPYAPDRVSSALEAYTATGMTGTFVNSPVGATAGDLVTTSDGYYGVFVSATAGSVTVDKWRARLGGTGIPAALSNCRVMNGKCILNNAMTTYIHRIIVSHSAQATFSVTDLWGNALYTHTPLGGGATGSTHTLEFCTGQGEPGLAFPGIVGFLASATTTTAVVVFSV